MPIDNVPAQAAEAPPKFDANEAEALIAEELGESGGEIDIGDAHVVEDVENYIAEEDADEADSETDRPDEEGSEDSEEPEEGSDDEAEEDSDDESDDQPDEAKGEKPKKKSGYQRLKKRHQDAVEALAVERAEKQAIKEENEKLLEAVNVFRQKMEDQNNRLAEEGYLDQGELRIRQLQEKIEWLESQGQRQQQSEQHRAQLIQQAREQAMAQQFQADAEDLCEKYGLKSPRSLLMRYRAEIDELDEGQEWPKLEEVARTQAGLRSRGAKRKAAEDLKAQGRANASAPKPTKPGRAPRRDFSKATVDNMAALLESEGIEL